MDIQWIQEEDDESEPVMSSEQVQVSNLAKDIQMQLTDFERRLKLFRDEQVVVGEPARALEYLTYMKSYLNDANRVLRQAEQLQ